MKKSPDHKRRRLGDAGRDLLRNDLSRRAFWIAVLAAVAAKLLLTALQINQIFPDGTPIDDEMMLRAAMSIGEGKWLGNYGWHTMAKHMFFSVWLWLLHTLHIPYLIGGQLLYLLACAVSAGALKPVLSKRLYRLAAFIVLWFSPYSFAQFTTRVYIDNIYPSLCLLFFAGVLGVCLRFPSPARGAIGYAVAAGGGLGLAWLTKDDAIWLVPFGVCAGLIFLLLVLFRKESFAMKIAKLALPATALALCLGCITGYKAMNYQYYGRFIISDYTSPEFKAAIAAMVRADTDTPHAHILICKQTRQKLYDAVPLMAQLGEELETHEYYNGWGWPEEREFNSAGVIWMIRKAAFNAGLADTPQKAEAFYTELARQINAACDSGALTSVESGLGVKVSATLVPYDPTYFSPTVGEIGRSLGTLLFFRQTSSLAPLSYATPEQAAVWSEYTYTGTSHIAIANTALPYYYPWQRAAEMCFQLIVWVYRVAIWAALFFAARQFARDLRQLFRGLKTRAVCERGMMAVLMLGVLLSGLLRIVLISYIEVSSFQIGTYLLYLAPAGAVCLLLAAYGAASALEYWSEHLAAGEGPEKP